MNIKVETVSFPYLAPFAITGHVFEVSETLRVTVSDGEVSGVGEAMGAYYFDESGASMQAELEALLPNLPEDLSLELIQEAMPPCGARTALDCAFWDYRAKKAGVRVWDLLDMQPKKLTTVYTLGVASAEEMGEKAARASQFPDLKIKLDAETPIERLEAIRAARPDANLIIDVNQGWSFSELKEYLPHTERLGIAMIEQPLPRGGDEELEGFKSPVPLGADESCCHMGEFEQTKKRYDVLNIKLDKSGGLTEGLALVKAAQEAGMGLMVGNMCGSSLSMAPSYVIGQSCRFVDIDGPLLLKHDVDNGLVYGEGGVVELPAAALWG